METCYRVVREQLYCRETGHYEAYGIVAVGPGDRTAYIPDISTEAWRVERLAEQLNRLKASYLHFMDHVLDSLI